MATIHGFGNVQGPDNFKRSPGVSNKQTEANPQVGSDGFVGSVPQETKTPETKGLPSAAPAAESRAGEAPSRSNVPITLSMDQGVGAIGLSSAADKISSTPFTNGLGSTTLVGLSGRVLAGGNPFGNS